MLQNVSVETGVTTGAIDDVPNFQEHQFIRQARNFLAGGSNPTLYYAAVRQSLPQVPGVEQKTARQLLGQIEMTLINTAAEELKLSNEARKDGNTKATKPADLYRKYSKDLRLIIERNSALTAIHAQAVLVDLFTEQSLSTGDLESPEYRDPYTGEYMYETLADFEKAIPDQHEPGLDELLKFIAMAPDIEAETTSTAISNSHKEVLRWAQQCREQLGWDDAQVEAFIDAQMAGYDSESDDEPVVYDDVDPYTPPTLIPNDLVLDRELWYSARDAVWAFNKARSTVFARMQKNSARRNAWRKRFSEMKHNTPKRKHWYQLYWKLRKMTKRKSWHDTFRRLMTRTEEFELVIDAIKDVAREDVVTAAAIYLSLAGDYGLMEGDINGIRGLYQLPEQYYKPEDISPGAYVPLLSFAQEWEDDLLNLAQDALSPTSETNPHKFPDILMDLITTDENGEIVIVEAPIRSTMPKYDPNPINTASWNIGFARAATAKTTWKQAEDAGWAEWRSAMDANAAKIYNTTLAKTKNRKTAMAAFWKACNKSVPRPQDKIKSIAKSKMGLVLESGREIAWNIVAIKLRNKELDVSGDIKPRLLAKLQELNIGKNVWDLLKS